MKYSGKHIMHLRIQKGLSQKGMAALMKMTQQNYSKIEHKSSVTAETVTLVLEVLDAKTTELDAIVNCFTPPPRKIK